ncbi:MAG: lipocalin family protein [Gillisia sp.]|nr:lipocalin family protein [Gillisia sp.]
MKKLSLFLSIILVALSFNSCSSDDDNVTPDKIIGKWRLSEIFVQIDQVVMEDDILTECDKKTTIEFFKNGTYTESSFESIDDTCNAFAPVNDTWENLGNSQYDFSGIDFSDFKIPGATVDIEFKVTFGSSKMFWEISGAVTFEGEQIPILIKVTFIDNDTYVPDKIIGKWQFDQEFTNGDEIELTECEKRMTVEFFDDGIFEEKEFYVDGLECIADEVNTGTWRNLGSDMYELSDKGAPEFKVTFANNKMTVEFTGTEEGVTADHKYIFIKVAP